MRRWPLLPILDGAGLDGTVLVAGSARSGTTWVGDVLAGVLDRRAIFEPFLVDHDGELPFALHRSYTLDQARMPMDLSLYVRPGEASTRTAAQIERLLRGRCARSRWTDRGVRPLHRYTGRVIKDVHANLLIGHAARAWPAIRVVYLIRDPIAAISSQLDAVRNAGWIIDWDVARYTSQRALVEDWLAPHLEEMRARALTLPERLAHRWCIENLVPRAQDLARLPNVLVVSYRALLEDLAAWQRLVTFVAGLPTPLPPRFAERLRVKSSTADPVREARRWTDVFVEIRHGVRPRIDCRLAAGDRDRVERIVRRYGLEHALAA